MDKTKQCYALIEFPEKATDVVPENWLFETKVLLAKLQPNKIKGSSEEKRACTRWMETA